MKMCFSLFQGNVTLGPTVENFLCELVPLQLAQGSTGGHPFQLTTELTDLEDGTYELKYRLPMEGHYELSIKLFGHHISASPFKVCIAFSIRGNQHIEQKKICNF